MLKLEERIFEQTPPEHSCCISCFIFFSEQLAKDIRMRHKIIVSHWLACVSFRIATWGISFAPAFSSRGAAPTTGWSTAQPFCPAAPLTPTLSLRFQWLSAATVAPAGPTAMSAHTEPAWMGLGAVNQSDKFFRTLARAITWFLFEPSEWLFC